MFASSHSHAFSIPQTHSPQMNYPPLPPLQAESLISKSDQVILIESTSVISCCVGDRTQTLFVIQSFHNMIPVLPIQSLPHRCQIPKLQPHRDTHTPAFIMLFHAGLQRLYFFCRRLLLLDKIPYESHPEKSL